MNEPPDDEDLRLEAVQKLDLLDQPAEERFERIVRLVRRHFRASACAITLLDTERAYYVAHYGMNGRQSPRSTSMCAQVVEGKLQIPDRPGWGYQPHPDFLSRAQTRTSRAE